MFALMNMSNGFSNNYKEVVCNYNFKYLKTYFTHTTQGSAPIKNKSVTQPLCNSSFLISKSCFIDVPVSILWKPVISLEYWLAIMIFEDIFISYYCTGCFVVWLTAVRCARLKIKEKYFVFVGYGDDSQHISRL